MKKPRFHKTLANFVIFLSSVGTGMINAEDPAPQPDKRAAQWPQWRGPDADGVAENADPPIEWSEDENIVWKVKVPGTGNSTPIIWGDRIYVAAASAINRKEQAAEGKSETNEATATDSQREAERDRSGRGGRRGFRGFRRPAPTTTYAFMVIAFDRGSGDELWRTVLAEEVPHEAGHRTNTFASSSPITDGRHIFVSFGSRGIYCLDMNGKKKWSRDLGQMQTRNQFGEGSSAALHDETLIVPWDHEGDSFIVAIDSNTGKEKWRQPRDEPTTWATPLITEYNGRTQVIASGSNRVRSYDLKSGELIWECGGQVSNPIPSPVRYQDNVIVMTGHRGYAIASIPLDSKGDITDSDAITWFEDDAAPYVPSPLLYKGQLYFVKSNQAILVSRHAADGKLLIEPTRLPEIAEVYASPVAANDRIYLAGRGGTTLVLKPGSEMKVLATNQLDAAIDASPAIVADEIYIRSKTHLYKLAD